MQEMRVCGETGGQVPLQVPLGSPSGPRDRAHPQGWGLEAAPVGCNWSHPRVQARALLMAPSLLLLALEEGDVICSSLEALHL